MGYVYYIQYYVYIYIYVHIILLYHGMGYRGTPWHIMEYNKHLMACHGM